MAGLVALLCLYLGTQNIKKAFTLAPFGSWVFINWALFVTGVIMLLLVLPLIKMAIKDRNAQKQETLEKERAQEEANRRKYSLDDEFEDDTTATYEGNAPKEGCTTDTATADECDGDSTCEENEVSISTDGE